MGEHGYDFELCKLEISHKFHFDYTKIFTHENNYHKGRIQKMNQMKRKRKPLIFDQIQNTNSFRLDILNFE